MGSGEWGVGSGEWGVGSKASASVLCFCPSLARSAGEGWGGVGCCCCCFPLELIAKSTPPAQSLARLRAPLRCAQGRGRVMRLAMASLGSWFFALITGFSCNFCSCP
ncbi:hypothetical protein FF950_11175 [Pseudoxanthomonas sp. X-1]|nr:hypothetical protein FF950_11175 [Pseudoxanthomonas sp. X-1]